MKQFVNISIGIAALSLAIAIISRLTLKPMTWSSIEANAFLRFADTCLFLSIALSLAQKVKE